MERINESNWLIFECAILELYLQLIYSFDVLTLLLLIVTWNLLQARNGNFLRKTKNARSSTKPRGYEPNTWRNTQTTSTDREGNPRPCGKKATPTVFRTQVFPWTLFEPVIILINFLHII